MKRMTAVGLATAVMAAATLGMASGPSIQVAPPSSASIELSADTASLDISPHDQSVELSKKCKCSGGCSMQKWMKKVMQKAVGSGDAKKVAKALRTIASKPVAGYGKWKAMAEAGAKAAESGDLKAAKKSCKACHKAYQKKYRKDKALRCGSW